MVDRPYHVLFLCTGNSARSVMAECAMNRWGAGKLEGWSAGSQPKGQIHPMTLRLLRQLDYDTSRLRSKSWDEFLQQGAPPLDIVVTVCDNAVGEICPVFWPGQPITAHWGVEDPAAFVGTEDETLACFRRVYGYLESRIKRSISLPIASLDRFALQKRLDEIGQTADAS